MQSHQNMPIESRRGNSAICSAITLLTNTTELSTIGCWEELSREKLTLS